MTLKGIVLNNTASANRVVETVKIAKAYGVKNVYFTRIYGAAAQSGIPEAFKYASKHGMAIAVFPELKDLVDVIDGKLLILAYNGKNVETEHEPYYLVIDGSDAGFEPLEARLGEKVWIENMPKNLPATASLAVALHELLRRKRIGEAS